MQWVKYIVLRSNVYVWSRKEEKQYYIRIYELGIYAGAELIIWENVSFEYVCGWWGGRSDKNFLAQLYPYA